MADKKKTVTELEPGTNEWLKAFDALSSQDKASIFNSQYDPTVSDFDYTFDEGVSGQPGAGTAGTGFIGAPPGYDLDPAFQQLLQFGGGVNIPQLSAKGALEPYDLSQEAQRVNLMQDNASSIADVILSSLAGPGALDPASFAPVVTKPTDRVATPGLTQLDRYARGTGYKGYIAQKIKAGATDDEAIADLFNFLDAPVDETVDPKHQALRQELIDSLPSAYKTGELVPPSGGGRGQNTSGAAGRGAQDTRDLFNESEISKWANDLYFKVADDQANEEAGWRDPESGFLYSSAPTQEDSPLTQKFKNLGLPTPFAAYDDPQYLQMAYDQVAPNLASDLGSWEENIAGTQAEQARIGKETRGPIDRNIETQRLYRENFTPGGFQARPNELQNRLNNIPGAPPSAPGGGMRMPGQPPGDVAARQQNFMNNINQAAQGGLASQYLPDQVSKFAPRGIANPGGGFDFGGPRPAEQQALGNAALNVFGAMPFAGPEKRGTKVVPLNEATTKQSAKDAEAARKKYAQANARSYEAMQYTSPDIGAAVRAAIHAQNVAGRGHPNAAVNGGSSPFRDAVMQRLIGQRAVGVRGL